MDYIKCLKWLHEQPEFQTVIEHVLKQRPTAPSYDYKEPNEETWKAMSLMQQGFDLVFSHLKMRIKDDE